MVRNTKRTSALAPSPPTSRDQPVLQPAMFGPASWCPPCAPQAMAPSSPWVTGLQHYGMAGSSAQGPWWTPSSNASTNHAPTVDNLEDSNMQALGVDYHPPGGLVNFLKKNTPAQAVSNGVSLQPITEHRLLWTKEEDVGLCLAE